MNKQELDLRQAIIAACRSMNARGVNQGTSGNISARYRDVMLITPSAMPYDEMKPGDIATMPIKGEYGTWAGRSTRPRNGASTSTSCARGPRSARSCTPTPPSRPCSRSAASRFRPATT